MAEPLSGEQLAQIERRCKLSMPGPWKSCVEGRDHFGGDNFIMTGGEDIYLTAATVNDQDFIASAREDIPLLICEIRRLRALQASSRQ
jgi:hypothetical protein